MVDVLALGSTDDVLAAGVGIGIGFEVLALCSGCLHCVRGVCIVFEVLALCSRHCRCVRGVDVVVISSNPHRRPLLS